MVDEDVEFLNKRDRLREFFGNIEQQHLDEKAWHKWNRLPPWKKYEQDYINGVDDGEPPKGDNEE